MRIFFFILILTLSLFSESIDRYIVDIDVGSRASLKIKEDINYNFGNNQRHGIFREIPVKVKIKGAIYNIDINSFEVQIDDSLIHYNKSYKDASNGNRVVVLRIGDADRLITGIHKYTIKYKINKVLFNYPKDNNKYVISFNAIGLGWKIPINNIMLSLHLPNNLLNAKLDTFTGNYGSKTTSATMKKLESGYYQIGVPHLNPHQAFTIDIVFNKQNIDIPPIDATPNSNKRYSYDDDTKYQERDNSSNMRSMFLPFAIFIIIFGYIKREASKALGYQPNSSIAPRYTPPKGVSIFESGLIIDTNADYQDFTAAVVELATMGYLKIETKNEASVTKTSKKPHNLTKDQEYLLNNILFANGSNKFIFSKSQRQDIFEELDNLDDIVYEESANKGYFLNNPQEEKQSFSKKIRLIFIPLITYFLYYMYANNMLPYLFPTIFISVSITVGLSIAVKTNDIFGKIFYQIFGAIFVIFPAFIMYKIVPELFISKVLFNSGYLVIMALFAIYQYFYYKIGSYTPKGAEIKNELLGLKEFIKRVKVDEIKRRLKQDPNYLDKLLPYSILFGYTKEFTDLYNQLNVNKPNWIDNDISNVAIFENSISDALFTSESSSSSSSFGGSGGSSGGGSGGGGGGSW